MSVWVDFGCLGDGRQIHALAHSHTHIHTFKHTHTETYMYYTPTLNVHELRQINQPSVEVRCYIVTISLD